MWFSSQKFEQAFCRQSKCKIRAAKITGTSVRVNTETKLGDSFLRASFSLTDSESSVDVLETKIQ